MNKELFFSFVLFMLLEASSIILGPGKGSTRSSSKCGASEGSTVVLKKSSTEFDNFTVV